MSRQQRQQLPEWTIVDFIHRGWWWNNRGILFLNMCLLLPLLTSVSNGLDSSLVNALQILPDWQDYFDHPHGIGLGLINSAQGIGAVLGLPFSPFASDIFGRRATLFFGSIIMLTGVGLQTAAWTITIFIVSRGLLGFGLSFCLNAAPLLLIELAYPTQRGKITSIYNSSWYVGSVISAWMCFGSYDKASGSVWSFRAPTLAQALIPLLQVIFMWFIPESPRWLVAKGRESEASRILAKYHADSGDERDPLVVFEMAQIRHALRTEQEANKSTTMLTLFATPGNRRRMRIIIAIAAFSQWSGNGLVSYYINLVLEGVGITSASRKAQINGALQIFNFVIAVCSAMLVDKVGRRPLFLISNTGMVVAFAMWTLTTALFNTQNNTAAATATIPLIFVFFFFYDVAYTPLLVAYTLEILPFRIRAKGFALMNLTIQITAAFNQFVNPWALKAIGWKYYLVYCGWLGFELVFVFMYIVETKGRSLEETAVVFDGENAEAELQARAGHAATLTMQSRGEIGTGMFAHQSIHEQEPALRSRTSDVLLHDSKEFLELKRLSHTDSSTNGSGSDRACSKAC